MRKILQHIYAFLTQVKIHFVPGCVSTCAQQKHKRDWINILRVHFSKGIPLQKKKRHRTIIQFSPSMRNPISKFHFKKAKKYALFSVFLPFLPVERIKCVRVPDVRSAQQCPILCPAQDNSVVLYLTINAISNHVSSRK